MFYVSANLKCGPMAKEFTACKLEFNKFAHKIRCAVPYHMVHFIPLTLYYFCWKSDKDYSRQLKYSPNSQISQHYILSAKKYNVHTLSLYIQ